MFQNSAKNLSGGPGRNRTAALPMRRVRNATLLQAQTPRAAARGEFLIYNF